MPTYKIEKFYIMIKICHVLIRVNLVRFLTAFASSNKKDRKKVK